MTEQVPCGKATVIKTDFSASRFLFSRTILECLIKSVGLMFNVSKVRVRLGRVTLSLGVDPTEWLEVLEVLGIADLLRECDLVVVPVLRRHDYATDFFDLWIGLVML